MRLVGAAMAGTVILALGACNEDKRVATGAPTADGTRVVAMLRDASGREVGRASATEVSGGIRFTIDATGLPPGTHGAHVHMTGRCDAPGFTTAGSHWNPMQRKHGTMNPQGPHGGDLPNLVIDSGGRGTIGAVIPGVTMAALLDPDGAAMVVHANPDDLMTDPSGSSGDRIACGVFQAG